MLTRILLLTVLPAHFAATAPVRRPAFVSEVVAPDRATVMPFLQAVCPDGIHTQKRASVEIFGCGDVLNQIVPAPAKRRYAWSHSVQWEADGIIFGHFLSATSEDVAVSGAGAETHPYLWGGTLLLTKLHGAWKPVWYKMGLVTRHCRRISLATGRQILFCEETDGGMGHTYHLLYAVDFLHPVRTQESSIFVADSYHSVMNGGVQKQSIDRVEFVPRPTREMIAQVFARHGGVKLRVEDQPRVDRNGLPIPAVRGYRIDFQLTESGFQVTPGTASNARLFGIQ
ncbi:MAG: hypothetical protein ABJF23_26070 [Bryobacteraceae bacterium]